MVLSQQLTAYSLRPRTIWIGEESAKRYMEEDFHLAYQRYLPRALVQAFLDEQRALQKELEEKEAKKQTPEAEKTKDYYKGKRR